MCGCKCKTSLNDIGFTKITLVINFILGCRLGSSHNLRAWLKYKMYPMANCVSAKKCFSTRVRFVHNDVRI